MGWPQCKRGICLANKVRLTDKQLTQNKFMMAVVQLGVHTQPWVTTAAHVGRGLPLFSQSLTMGVMQRSGSFLPYQWRNLFDFCPSLQKMDELIKERVQNKNHWINITSTHNNIHAPQL